MKSHWVTPDRLERTRADLRGADARHLCGAARKLPMADLRICVVGGALWADYGANGVARSKLTALLIDKACGSPTTGRNWNSVLKFGKMIEDRVGEQENIDWRLVRCPSRFTASRTATR